MSLKELLETPLLEFDKYKLDLGNLINIAVIIVVSWGLLYLIKLPLNRRIKKGNIEKSSAYAAMQIARYIVWTLSTLLCLQAAGLNISLLLAGSAALLVGIGLGLQQTFSDFISGIILLLDASIRIDDILEFDGMICRVVKIGVRTSTVVTRDDVQVIVPNSKFTSDKVINWTHTGKLARFTVSVGVNYNADVEKVKECLLACSKAHDKVLKVPEPMVRFEDFGDSSLEFSLFFYTREIFRVENIRSELRFDILKRFRENLIEIPYPQRDLHIRTTGSNPL